MPHGAGHVGGGGGFHGGGFHGGGFHHHGGGFHHHGGGFHHHRFGHHHRHHHHGGWWWWGGPGYYYGSPGYYAYRRVWGCACFWLWMVVALVIVAISVTASVGPSSSSSDNEYTPGATRIIKADSTFCSGLTLSGTNANLGATLYSLSRPPALTSWNNFTLQEPDTSVPHRGYAYYQFYMRTGSTANGTNCIHTPSSVSSMQLLIIRGTSNFNSWMDNPRSSKALYSYTINQMCPNGNPFTFQATQDNYFFFVYYNTASSSGSVNVDLQLFRKEYTVDHSAVMDSCKYDGVLSCDITTSGGATYLLVVDSQVLASETSDFSVDCIADGGIIAVIVIIPLLVLTVVVGLIIVLLCYYRYKHSKKAATTTTAPTASDPMVQPAQPEVPPAAIVNVTTVTPPAYNPNYAGDPTAPPPYTPPAPAPSYGSTAAKPPGY